MSSKPIPRLNYEDLLKIFSYLNYDDLLVMRKADERFKNAVDSVIGHSLVWLKEEEDYSASVKLFGTDENAQVDECLVCRSVVGFKLDQEARLHIKKLIVPDPFLVCKNLSTLQSLEHLEIKSTKAQNTGSILLKFENLRILNIELPSFEGRPIFILDCPNLTCLKINIDMSRLNVMIPSSIQTLDCKAVGSKITEFANLKKLVLNDFTLWYSCVEKLKYLKEIHLGDPSFHQRLFREANRFFNQLNGAQNVNIYYKGINIQADPLLNNDVLSITDWLTSSGLDVYAHFLDFIKGDLLQPELQIDALDSRNCEVLLKLTNLRYIQVTGEVKDRAKWVALLKASKIEELKLMSRIDQDLLDLIPRCCAKSLVHLELVEFDNLQFCLDLKHLSTLKTSKLFDFDLFKRLMLPRSMRLFKFADKHKIEIASGRVKCYFDDAVVLDETVDTFWLNKFRFVSDWTNLFHGDLLE